MRTPATASPAHPFPVLSALSVSYALSAFASISFCSFVLFFDHSRRSAA
ncbi:hypothetical protein ACWD7F_12520 [Streptomyces sp. NPDC005122]